MKGQCRCPGERTSDDLDTGSVTSVHHVFVLLRVTTLRLKLVADDLVVGPPLAALDMLIEGVHLNITVSYVADSAPVRISLGGS